MNITGESRANCQEEHCKPLIFTYNLVYIVAGVLSHSPGQSNGVVLQLSYAAIHDINADYRGGRNG